MPSGGGVGCSRLGTCKRQKPKSPPKSVSSVPTFNDEETNTAAQSGKTDKNNFSTEAPAPAPAPKSKKSRKRKGTVNAAVQLPIAASNIVANNGNWKVVGAKTSTITPEERERRRKADAKEARRISAELAQRKREQKEAEVSGYLKYVAATKPTAATSNRKTKRKVQGPTIINNPDVTFNALLGYNPPKAASSVASSAASRRSSVASSAASRRSSVASSAASRRSSNAAAAAAAAAPVVFLPISGTVGAGSAMPTLRMIGDKLVIQEEAEEEKAEETVPMGGSHLQGFMLKMTTELNNLVNSGAIVSTLIAKCIDPITKIALVVPENRFLNVYRFLVKGTTAEVLITQNISLPYSPKADKGKFPFKIISDIDATILINPRLNPHDFEVIRQTLLSVIIDYFDRLLKNPPPETEAIKAELDKQGYAFDPSNNRILYEKEYVLKSESANILRKYEDPSRFITWGSMFNMRIIPNILDLKSTVIRLFTRTKVPGTKKFEVTKIKPKTVEVFDIAIPTMEYALLPLAWIFTTDYTRFEWPERQYSFPIYGPLAQFIERTYGLYNYYTDELIADLPPGKYKNERIKKKAKWIPGLVKLKELASKNPYSNTLIGILAPVRDASIGGVKIATILDEYTKA